MKKLPFVSVLTPTYNRQRFFNQYLKLVARQDYEGTIEILVLDDGSEDLSSILKADSRIRYIKLEKKQPIGHKRNILCDEAKGDLIVHMDDDDFYFPTRISSAVNALQSNNFLIAGTARHFIYDTTTKDDAIFQCGPLGPFNAGCASMAYWSEYLNNHQYDDAKNKSEELEFTNYFKEPMYQLDPFQTMIVIQHGKNTVGMDLINCQIKTHFTAGDFIKNKQDRYFYQSLRTV
jgi:glycosyltransferase involved in cell wall biosynthesis